MRPNIFNSYIPVSEKTSVVYNALSDKSIFINSDKLKTLLSYENEDVYDVSENIKNVILVENDNNEYDEYVENMRNEETQTYSYHLIINPTLDCIFSCWYCYEAHPKGKMNSDILNRIKLLISKIAETYESLTISFFGGEPMMCYSSVMIPIVKYAFELFKEKNKQFSFNMTTNGFLFTVQRIEELKKYGFRSAQITLDGDESLHNEVRFVGNKLPTYKKIIENIKLIVESECYVTLRLNCTHTNIRPFQHVVEDLKQIKDINKNRLSIDCQIVWQEKNKDELQTKMHSLVSHFTKFNLNASKMDFRSFCYADLRSECVVNYNGDLYKCTANDFHNTPRDGYLSADGEIVWENDSHERRMNSKLKNKKCHTCRVLPLCHGGCTRTSLRAKGDYCLYPSEKEKDQLVINRLEYIVTNHKFKQS